MFLSSLMIVMALIPLLVSTTFYPSVIDSLFRQPCHAHKNTYTPVVEALFVVNWCTIIMEVELRRDLVIGFCFPRSPTNGVSVAVASFAPPKTCRSRFPVDEEVDGPHTVLSILLW